MYTLSYVLTTYNKLPYLKQVVERLVAARQPDEEIVVCDGGSSDGTPAYLQGLFEAGQIQQFVSERDKGEAHGFNKAMLRAKGELIKLITDDDAFCYPAIADAKNFMLTHPEVDVLTGNTGLIHLERLETVSFYDDVADNFHRWFNNKEVVWMIGLPLMIRREALALTGLLHTGVVQVDTEFTYRITSLNVNIAWSTAMMSVRLENPQSNFRVMNQGNKWRRASDTEIERMRYYYDKGYGKLSNILAQRVPFEWIKRPLRPFKRALFTWLNRPQYEGNTTRPTGYQPGTAPSDDAARLSIAFRVADEFMTAYNADNPTEFLFKSNALTKTLSKE
jgi:hypothetical protein